LTPQELADFQALFISVDPARDTPERLKEYGEYFHERILGVTGTREQIDKVVKQYGAAYRIVKEDSAASYLVDHSADLYFLDRQGKLVHTLPHGTPPDQILGLLRTLLGESG
jgi:protein SCO1/2